LKAVDARVPELGDQSFQLGPVRLLGIESLADPRREAIERNFGRHPECAPPLLVEFAPRLVEPLLRLRLGPGHGRESLVERGLAVLLLGLYFRQSRAQLLDRLRRRRVRAVLAAGICRARLLFLGSRRRRRI